MYSEHNISPSSQGPCRGWRGRRGDRDMYKGWQEKTWGDSGCTGGDRERLGRTGDMYRGWLEQRSGGYVQGVARDRREVQGMMGMEGDFQWDSGFWNQYYCLTVHITEHFLLVCISVFFLSFCLSIYLSCCLSFRVNLFLIHPSDIPCGYRAV